MWLRIIIAAVALVGLYELVQALRRRRVGRDGDGENSLNAMPCPWCDEYITEEPELDESSQCNICGRVVNKDDTHDADA